jgi:hypothetical protein
VTRLLHAAVVSLARDQLRNLSPAKLVDAMLMAQNCQLLLCPLSVPLQNRIQGINPLVSASSVVAPVQESGRCQKVYMRLAQL